ncbi:hypothetical protein [uncultured Dokdonia sp.]|uniref:hypothetical protein n=1 Tax=uncultured Dokdonia sp. TaxID=575653 RepID=UPI002611B36D|nr:hypothetical protein [uncultured Dokdonia sp.]
MKTIDILLKSLSSTKQLETLIQKQIIGGNYSGVDPEISSFGGNSSIATVSE